MRDEGTVVPVNGGIGGGQKFSISPADAVVLSVLAFTGHDADKIH